LLSEQQGVENIGGTMRLGAFQCNVVPGSKAEQAYGTTVISERHRHRFEFNNAFKEQFEKNGLMVSGILNNNTLCEIAEVQNHPWMVGVQFHPEFKSKPGQPHPLFKDFIGAVIKNKKSHG
jgi:CTP synthase